MSFYVTEPKYDSNVYCTCIFIINIFQTKRITCIVNFNHFEIIHIGVNILIYLLNKVVVLEFIIITIFFFF